MHGIYTILMSIGMFHVLDMHLTHQIDCIDAKMTYYT